MLKNKLRTGSVLNKLHNQEHIFKKELSKTFLEYLDGLPTHKRIEQIQSLLYERNLPTSDRGLTLQEKRCLYLASQGKEIKEAANILGLSQRTIKYHRANIIKKLQVPNITAAVASSFQFSVHRNVDDLSLSLNTDQNFQLLLKNIINIVPGNVYWLDKNAFAIGCNKNVLSMFGFKSNAEFKGLSFEDMGEVCNWSQEAIHSFKRDSLEVLHSGRAKLNIKEPVITNRKGKFINFLTSRVPICDHNKNVIGIFGVSIEITDQKL